MFSLEEEIECILVDDEAEDVQKMVHGDMADAATAAAATTAVAVVDGEAVALEEEILVENVSDDGIFSGVVAADHMRDLDDGTAMGCAMNVFQEAASTVRDLGVILQGSEKSEDLKDERDMQEEISFICEMVKAILEGKRVRQKARIEKQERRDEKRAKRAIRKENRQKRKEEAGNGREDGWSKLRFRLVDKNNM